MVVSDFTDFFLLILNQLIVNPLFILLYQTVLVLLLIRITLRLFNVC